MVDTANPYQGDYWNGAPGQVWVTREGDLDLLHQGVLDLLLTQAAPRAGERVLDIGCGAGASSLAFAEAGCAVLGLDISVPLVARARERAGTRAEFAVGDAQVADLAGFDLAVSRFGVMFFADPVAAFANIAKGLVPGGRLVMACWAGMAVNPWFALTAEVAAARLGALVPGDPHAPGPMAFADIARVEAILAAAGFAQARGVCHTVALHHPGGIPAVVDLAAEVGPIARSMRERGGGPEDLAAIKADLAEQLSRYVVGGQLKIPAGINLFTARRG